MKQIWHIPPLALALTLAACGGDGDGTTVSINAGADNFMAQADKDGRVTVRAPGFDGSIKLPKFQIGADNFEIDGVKLYPGSTISNFNVDAGQGKDARVKIDFDTPAAAQRAQDWFREQMQSAGFTVDLKDGALQGKTSEGSDFTLRLTPDGESKSKGTLDVAEK